MSNVFAKAKPVSNEKVEDDFIPGTGLFDTDIYAGTIKTVYIGKAANSQAVSVNFIIDINGKELRETIWTTNRDGGVTYKDKKTGDEKNLPGFNQVNSACMLIAGKELGEMDVEELTVKIYDFDAKKELPQAVDCFPEFHGEKCHVAVQRVTVDKQKKNEASGEYENTGETRDQNTIIKFFPADKLVTISEVAEYIKSLGASFDDTLADGHLLKAISKMDDEAGNYADKWLSSNKGQTYNKSSGAKAEGKAFKGGNSAGNSGGSSAKKTSLFDD